MAAVAAYPDGSDFNSQSMSRRKPETWDYKGLSSQEVRTTACVYIACRGTLESYGLEDVVSLITHIFYDLETPQLQANMLLLHKPMPYPSAAPLPRSQNSMSRRANNMTSSMQQSNGNARPPNDPTQREVGEKLSRNGTPSSTKVPSINDSSYLSPPKGGKLRPALSDGNRSGSDADSLLDLYGHPRSIAEGTEKSERDVTLEDLYHNGEDLDNSRWIHRDKLAVIESHELQEAGIKLPKQRRSKNSLRYKKSHSRNQSTTSVKDQAPDASTSRDYKRQKVPSPVRQPVQDSSEDYDLRPPEERVSEAATIRGPSAMYNQPHLGKSGSKIPVPKTSPLPMIHSHIEGSTPHPRQRGVSGNSLGGDEEGFSYNRIRGRSNSVGSRALLDDSEVNGTPTPVSRLNGVDVSPGSPPKQRLVSKAGSVTNTRPKTSNGPRNVTDPQKSRPSPSSQRSSPAFPRPKSRNGLEARPATAINRPEGEAPWIAEMYKPDPRLPPEQQMLPTHAKRLQQEQKEREAREAGLTARQQQQQTPTPNRTLERPIGITRTPSPAAQDNQSPQQQFYTPQQQPYYDRDPWASHYPPSQQPSNNNSPSSPGGGNQWPLRVAPPIKPPSTTNINNKNNPTDNSPTGSTAANPADQPHGGYSTIPKVQSTPPIGSAPSPKMGTGTGMGTPQAMVQEKPRMQEKEGKKEKGCGCCVVM
ncbi:MAG: hypothetical protein Q9218_005451 [Villophora microphyllina]